MAADAVAYFERSGASTLSRVLRGGGREPVLASEVTGVSRTQVSNWESTYVQSRGKDRIS